MGPRFYVVQTQYGCDDLAYNELKPHFEVLYLTVAFEGRIGTNRFQTLESLFPGYLITKFDWSKPKAWTIPSMRGVKSLLGYTQRTGKPTALSDSVVEDLVQRFIKPALPSTPVDEGDDVIITSGVFTHHRATCTMSKGERVKVLLNVLGGSHVIELPRDAVMSA